MMDLKRLIQMKRTIRVAFVGMAAVLLFLIASAGFVSAVAADRGNLLTTRPDGTASGRIPFDGGVIATAGDASLPVALTGVSARGAVLMEAESGTVVFGQNENARLSMASTTKIMTALVALEHMPLDTSITVTDRSVGVEGSSIYLSVGETLTLEDLLYALMLESANDAAETIAVAVSGDVPAFAALMNEKAAELGLTDTQFVNPHGLDAEGHYTTAKELALLTCAALQNPDFCRIVATERHTIPLHNTDGVRLLLNHNKLLRSYEGCIGVKTGFTKKTGRCLVSAAERDGVRLVAVTLGAPDDWRDHTAMLDYGFALYDRVSLCEPGFYAAPLPLVSGESEYVIVENTDTLTVTLPRNHGRIVCVVERRRFDFAPVSRGDEVGRLRFFEERPDGTHSELGEVPIYAAYDVKAITYKQGFFARLFG